MVSSLSSSCWCHCHCHLVILLSSSSCHCCCRGIHGVFIVFIMLVLSPLSPSSLLQVLLLSCRRWWRCCCAGMDALPSSLWLPRPHWSSSNGHGCIVDAAAGCRNVRVCGCRVITGIIDTNGGSGRVTLSSCAGVRSYVHSRCCW